MARSSQSDTESRRLAGLSGAKLTCQQESNQGSFYRKLVAYLSRFATHEWSVAVLYLFLDMASWIAIYGIVGWLRYDAFYATPFQFFIIDLIQLAVIVQALYFIGGYDRAVEKRTLAYATEHLLAIIVASGVSALLIYSAATFDQTMKPSRAVLLLSFMIFLAVSLFYRRWIQKYVAAGNVNRAFLVIGSGPAAVRFYEAYQRSPNSQQLHFVDLGSQRAGQRIAGEASPVVEGDIASRLDDLGEHYSGIILTENVSSLGTRLLERLVRTQFHQTRVYTLESFYETHWRYVPFDMIDPVWPLQTGFQLARTSPYHYLKRLFDIGASAVALILCAPLLALIVVVIWIEEGRPVLFSQRRVGREGRRFDILKFRTMRLRSSEQDEDIYTRKDDPRITGVGHWLRKLHLDELPQLWNVFKGDLSLIGPRAEWTECAERYEQTIPFYHFRHLVKPGITGWAQVNYPYGESDQDAVKKLQYDLYYIRHYSLKLDAMIALKTVYTMLFGKGR